MSRGWLTFLILLFCVSTVALAKQDYALIGAWDFENGYTDVSGYEPLYTGTGLGAHSIVYDADLGSNVVQFPGPAGRVSFGPSAAGKLRLRNVVTVACWIKINVPSSTADWQAVWGRGGGGYRAFMHKSDAVFCLFQYGLAGGNQWPHVFVNDANYVPDNSDWMHIGFAYDGDYARGYVNGRLYTELQVEDFNTIEGWKRDLWEWDAQFTIGGLVGWTYYFKGWMDDVAIYHGVLDETDFNDLYTGSKTIHDIEPKPPYGQFTWDNNTVAAYQFEQDTADLSPGPAPDAALLNDAAVVFDVNQGYVLYTDGNDPNLFYVDCGIEDKFEDIEGFTLTAWINPDDDGNDAWGALVAKGGAGYRMFYHAGGLIGTVNAGDTPWEESLGQGGFGWMQPGQWYHVAIVYDPNFPDGFDPNDPDPNNWSDPHSLYPPEDPNSWPGRLRGFIDGVNALGGDPRPELSENHFRGPRWDTSADPLTIKLDTGGFRGMIDDVRVYNRPLNQLEVRWLMNQDCAPGTVGRDFTGDCSVNYDDLNILAVNWLDRYDFMNYARMAQLWLEEDLLWPY